MEFLVNANRKIIRLICTIFIVACVLGVDVDLSIAMGGKACAKLRGQISDIRKHVDEGRNTYRDLMEALTDARGDHTLYISLRKQIMQFADEAYKERMKLKAKEELYDRECRPPK